MFAEALDHLREIWESPWEKVTLPKLLSAFAAVALVLLVYVTSEEGWVPILDSLNLVFHEAGHPLFSPFGETLHFLGGTLMRDHVDAVSSAGNVLNLELRHSGPVPYDTVKAFN